MLPYQAPFTLDCKPVIVDIVADAANDSCVFIFVIVTRIVVFLFYIRIIVDAYMVVAVNRAVIAAAAAACIVMVIVIVVVIVVVGYSVDDLACQIGNGG
jgi:hypothetical protein